MTTEEFKQWVDEKIDEAISETPIGIGDGRSYWDGRLTALKSVKEKYLSICPSVQQKRDVALEQGYDDYCEAHDMPYNKECPECASYVKH